MNEVIVQRQHRFLKLYYKFFFPADEIVQWLSYGDMNIFQTREFAYTTSKGAFKRYISFTDAADMVALFEKEVPTKIDICAVYNICPQYIQRKLLRPLHKEFVIDIDLTDYDELRICCSGTKTCERCWVYMIIACKILNASLREDWGFKHILWVYSGRRGVHIWVCDAEVQWLDSKQRAGIADFFQLVKGSVFGKTRVHLNKMHVSIQRALKIIEPYFIPKIVVGQDMLANKHAMNKFLGLLPTKATKNEVRALFGNYFTSVDRWHAFLNYIKTETEKGNKVWLERRFFVQETILRYCYPRLDVSVTTSLNHLLKLPFSVHPETGKIAIVFDVDEIDSFNPFRSPTVSSVWKEKIAYNCNNKSEDESTETTKIMKEYEKTGLKKPIEVFKTFIANLETNFTPMMARETAEVQLT